MPLKSMQDRHLALLGIQPSAPGDVRAIAAAGLGLIAVTLLALPWADLQLPKQPAVVPFTVAAIIFTRGITALLLFNQFQVSGARSLLLLAGIFECGVLVAIARFLTFPGVLSSFASAPRASPWLWHFGHIAVMIGAFWYWAVVRRNSVTEPAVRWRAIVRTASALPIAVLLVSASLIIMNDRLPAFFIQDDSVATRAPWFQILCVAEIVVPLVAATLLLTSRDDDTALTRWFSLVLIAIACVGFGTTELNARYSLYWYQAGIVDVFAACIILVVLLTRLASLYSTIAGAAAKVSASNIELERGVAERTAELTKVLSERNLLLREVYHRVKNNLQLLDSLLALQAARLTDEDARDALARLRSRIHALGLVHQQLMASDNLATFEMLPFLLELTEAVIHAESTEPASVRLQVESDRMLVNLDFAIPLGLLVTELLTDALKHAFPDGTSQVSVTFRCGEDRRGLLTIADDGLAPAAVPRPYAGRVPMGTKIVRALVAQLDGEIRITYDKGTSVEVSMPVPIAA